MINSYIAIDLEMTGLNPKYDKIIEIGAVKVVNGIQTDTFSTFVNPGRILDANIAELTNISEDELKHAPDISSVIGKLVEFCADYPLVGHHIITDYSFIKQAAVNAGLEYTHSAIDTLKLSRCCHPDLAAKNLKAMCEHYGIFLSAHRALNDAMATSELYLKLGEAFYEKYPDIFVPAPMKYSVKKESPIRPSQKERIESLIARHKIDCPYDLNLMSRNEATRYYDKLRAEYGK